MQSEETSAIEPEKSKKSKLDDIVVDFLNVPEEDEILVAIDSESEDGGETTFSGGACNYESGEKPTFKVLPPHLPKHMIKGSSKINISKGKRPMVNYTYNIEGDLVPSQNTLMKRIFELTEESIRHDKLERIRGTLKERITQLHLRKLYTIEDVVKVFYSQAIPISLKLPISLSTTSLATLLLVEETSDFLELLRPAMSFQDLIRKSLLEEKDLPICRCGYIYVHPSLTYTNHPTKPDIVIGNLGNVVAVENKKVVNKRLNSLRLFLEILFTHLNSVQ